MIDNESMALCKPRTYVSELIVTEVGKLHLSVSEEKTVLAEIIEFIDFLVANWVTGSGKISKLNILNVRTIWVTAKMLRQTIVDIIQIRKNKKRL